MRLSFGTYIGLENPMDFLGDASEIIPRSKSEACKIIVALYNDEIVGSIVITIWGKVGFFGPLSIHPNLWDKKIG